MNASLEKKIDEVTMEEIGKMIYKISKIELTVATCYTYNVVRDYMAINFDNLPDDFVSDSEVFDQMNKWSKDTERFEISFHLFGKDDEVGMIFYRDGTVNLGFPDMENEAFLRQSMKIVSAKNLGMKDLICCEKSGNKNEPANRCFLHNYNERVLTKVKPSFFMLIFPSKPNTPQPTATPLKRGIRSISL